jgi:hypothetical protein
MDRRLVVVAFTVTLAATAFIIVETLKGILEHTIRALENCVSPCVIGPPPPESPERQVVKWLLIGAVAILDIVLIKQILVG